MNVIYLFALFYKRVAVYFCGELLELQLAMGDNKFPMHTDFSYSYDIAYIDLKCWPQQFFEQGHSMHYYI